MATCYKSVKGHALIKALTPIFGLPENVTSLTLICERNSIATVEVKLAPSFDSEGQIVEEMRRYSLEEIASADS